jgi:hypothetical protein
MSFKEVENFWSQFTEVDVSQFQIFCKHILSVYGTSRACNRFDVGNCIEFSFADDMLRSIGFDVESLPNAVRYDIHVKGHGHLSIKYTSSGDITLHNSQGMNKDMNIKDTMIITPSGMYLLEDVKIKEFGITISEYLTDKGDKLILKRKILKDLEKAKYPLIRMIDIQVDKRTCQHKQCSEVLYKFIKQQLQKQDEERKNIDLLSSELSNLNTSSVE